MIRWEQPSTWRGLIWLVASLAAIVLAALDAEAAATTALTAGAALAGGVGLLTNDQGENR